MNTKDSLNDELADMSECLEKALKWWDDKAQYLTTGDYGGRNVFDDDPVWVVEARKLLEENEDDAPTSSPVLLSGARNILLNTDAELLGKNPNAMVRQEPSDDIAVKQLYDIWCSLEMLWETYSQS
jgi:hypothetical protein